MILWLGLGAAFIQPLYFWLHTHTKDTIRDSTIPHNEAIALFFAALPSFLLPLFLFAPPWLNLSSYQHHGYIGLFLGSPFLIVVVCLTAVGFLTPWHGLVSKKDPKKPNIDKPWIVSTFILVGFLSAGIHLTCIGVSLFSSNPDMSLSRVFLPSPSKMHAFTPSSDLNSSLPPAYHILYEGYDLFTQLDYLIVSAACVVFAHWMLHNRGGDAPEIGAIMTDIELRDLLLHALGALLVGPAAVGSFAFAVREEKIRRGVGSGVMNGNASAKEGGLKKMM